MMLNTIQISVTYIDKRIMIRTHNCTEAPLYYY